MQLLKLHTKSSCYGATGDDRFMGEAITLPQINTFSETKVWPWKCKLTYATNYFDIIVTVG